MHVRVWLHETKAYVSGDTQDNFFLVPTKTDTAMAVPAVVAATAPPQMLYASFRIPHGHACPPHVHLMSISGVPHF